MVQGGTFYNDAVLRSMELLLHKNVIRPDIAGLMGAYGAAILALESGQNKSSILPAHELESFKVTTKSFRCHGCGNACQVTVQNFPDGGRYLLAIAVNEELVSRKRRLQYRIFINSNMIDCSITISH